MDDAKLRAWWWHKQGLDGSLAGKNAAQVLQSSGWARSVAGAGPYLTLFSRAGLRRPEVDASLAAIEIHELPAARACTHILPASDYALGLSAGQPFSHGDRKAARKLGVTDDEVARLQDAVARALLQGPQDPDALRLAAGDAIRSLGPEGVKNGFSTTLPLALGAMQSTGQIRRIPINGRLDQQRYRYALWHGGPLENGTLPPEQTFVELARHFFRWTGCASAAEFQWFSGLGVKAAKEALAPLHLEAVDGRLMLPEDRAAFEKFKPSRLPQYALVSSLDNIGQLRRDLQSLLHEDDRDRHGLGGTAENVKARVVDMPSHAIVDRGRVVGWWEYDPAVSAIAWMSFIRPDAALQEAVNRTEAFIREDLGDARSFSLDSPKSRVPKIAALRKGRLK